jgi:hypothetical protein
LVWFDLPKKDRDKLAGYPLYQDRRILSRPMILGSASI